MRHYANLSYFLRPKHLQLLPANFRNCIFNNSVQLDSFGKACSYRSSLMGNCCRLEGKSRSVKEMISIETMRPILGGVLQKIADSFKVHSALELGTCLGVGTMFLATSVSGKITTVDCNKTLSNYASDMFRVEGVNNVDFVCDTIEHYLQEGKSKFDLIYIDGEHTAKALLYQYEHLTEKFVEDRYILVFDDINYSRDMCEAWNKVSAMESDSLRVNLFRWGMVFHGYDLPCRDVCAWIRL